MLMGLQLVNYMMDSIMQERPLKSLSKSWWRQKYMTVLSIIDKPWKNNLHSPFHAAVTLFYNIRRPDTDIKAGLQRVLMKMAPRRTNLIQKGFKDLVNVRMNLNMQKTSKENNISSMHIFWLQACTWQMITY